MAIIHGSRLFGYKAENWLKKELMYSKHSSSFVVVDLYGAGAVPAALRNTAALRALVLSRPSAVNTPAFIFHKYRPSPEVTYAQAKRLFGGLMLIAFQQKGQNHAFG
jgi:hypothetical protein